MFIVCSSFHRAVTHLYLYCILVYIFLLCTAATLTFSFEDRFPSVIGIRIAVGKINTQTLVRITWQDFPTFRGTYLIYRHTSDISVRNIAETTFLGEVEQGVQFFIDDTIEVTGSYYYAVISKNTEDILGGKLIPLVNRSLIPIYVKIDQETPQNDKTNNRKINIPLNIDVPLIMIKPKSPQYLAFPSPVIPTIDIMYPITMQNLTPRAISVPTDVRSPAQSLSLLSPIGIRDEQEQIFSDAVPFSIENQAYENDITTILNSIKNEKTVQDIPDFFSEDLQATAKLLPILTTNFIDYRWEQSIYDLQIFLERKHTPEEQIHAQFYLGQALYFSKQYPEALAYLNTIAGKAYGPSAEKNNMLIQKWIKKSYAKLTSNTK